MSTAEMTGVQALERKPPDWPMQAGHVLHRAFEYVHHRTVSGLVNFEVAAGRIGQLAAGSTRPDADFRAPIRATVDTAPHVVPWHGVVDTLNTHPSASLVGYLAAASDLDSALGVTGKVGILAAMPSRAPLLSEPTHRIVLHATPNQASWLNQGDSWFSLLVRKLLQRGTFTSVAALKAQVLAFIAYFNRTMAKSFRWTYQGMTLAA